ncbi:MAG: D-alanyl-D-alanine carboxypeptidase family protein [Armatimonadota bacterium]|nr:D-alanyl-D-alanine carboxypeptidase [bacterium]MCS7309530.1 D-alanyl-D-alanine carboxypeptidase [Armatimonadota bacterium]MDW8105337.1 D-alanyl-D-alanine carboxypeptidase family protein [Armatimonadota bacterium]MDW8289460.1 D-alanyl-D-alanine carboxypeptidase family protein [Armatimonadota bacterium]
MRQAIILCLIWCLTGVAYALPPPVLKAKSAIVVDAETGQVLYELRADERRPMASTTKMMTAILLIERGNLDDLVVATENAIHTRYANLNMTPGETIPLRDLLYAILLRSSNDGSVAAAEYLCGTEERFVQLMNEKAQELGLTNTHFANPHGLDHPEHYSTARDLATLARYCIQNPVFNEIVRTRRVRILRSVNQQDVIVTARAKVLKYLAGADGIKSGYTAKAGRCFVGSVTRDGWRLISVVLGSTDADSDTRALIEWAYKQYTRIDLAKAGGTVGAVQVDGAEPESVPVVASAPLRVIVPRRWEDEVKPVLHLTPVHPPIERGQPLGELRAVLRGKVVAKVPVAAAVEARVVTGSALTVWMVLGGIAWLVSYYARRGLLMGYRRAGNVRRSGIMRREE